MYKNPTAELVRVHVDLLGTVNVTEETDIDDDKWGDMKREWIPPKPNASIISPVPNMATGMDNWPAAWLRDIPAGVSFGPKISGTIASLVGESILCRPEDKKVSEKNRMKPHTLPLFENISVEIDKVVNNNNNCEMRSSFFRLKRSASAPPYKPKVKAPTPLLAPIRETSNNQIFFGAFCCTQNICVKNCSGISIWPTAKPRNRRRKSRLRSGARVLAFSAVDVTGLHAQLSFSGLRIGKK